MKIKCAAGGCIIQFEESSHHYRHRQFCSDKCKMRDYRKRKAASLRDVPAELPVTGRSTSNDRYSQDPASNASQARVTRRRRKGGES